MIAELKSTYILVVMGGHYCKKCTCLQHKYDKLRKPLIYYMQLPSECKKLCLDGYYLDSKCDKDAEVSVSQASFELENNSDYLFL